MHHSQTSRTVLRSPWSTLLLASLLGTACAKDTGGGDGGSPVPDICNTQNDGTTDPQCELKLVTNPCGDGGICGTASGQYYINKKGKQLWLKVLLPQNLVPINLFKVTAEYVLPSTPVNLDLNLLDVLPSGSSSLAHQFDSHGSGSPKPVTIIVPTPSPAFNNHEFMILVGDHTNLNAEVRQPFSIRVDLVLDLDPNNPNIVNPLPLTPTSTANVVAGSVQGYLSTPNRADRFSVDVPGTGRQILYVSLKASIAMLGHPAPYLLSYLIAPDPLNPNQTPNPVAQDQAPNAYTDPDLATARLVTGGTYDITVLQTPTYQGGPTPGEPALQFTLTVMAMPDVDPNEPNDTLVAAEGTTGDVLTFTTPGPTPLTRTGRLSYVGDSEWFAVDLPASASPTRLGYQLTPSAGPGRFPPLPSPSNRWLQMMTKVTGDGGSPTDACDNDPNECPRDARTDDSHHLLLGGKALRDADCHSSDGALCPWSSRLEDDMGAPKLANFQGQLPIAPHGATQRYYFNFRDLQGQYVDDIDYTLTVLWQPEVPDKASGLHDSPGNATVTSITVDSAAASFPAPPANSEVARGIISTGYGFNVVEVGGGQFLPNDFSGGIRRDNDYDAFPSSTDVYQIDFPNTFTPADFADGGQYASGSTWELQWSVDNGSNGKPPYEIGLEVEFCALGDAGPGTCVPVPNPAPDIFAGASTLAYRTDQLATWYNWAYAYTAIQDSVWDDSKAGGADTVTGRANGCFCFEPEWMQAGKFYVTVVARNRISYEEQPYHLRMALTDYPKTFNDPDAGLVKCPVEVSDLAQTTVFVGCKFSLQIAGQGIPDAG